MIRGLAITLSHELIRRVTTFPLGAKWVKERIPSTATKNNLFLLGEEYIEDKNGVIRKSLPYPCDEFSFHIMKFVSCEGRLSMVYENDFRLLNELRFQGELPLGHRLSVPHFLLNSITDMSHKVRQRKYQHLAHHGLIKLIVNDALRRRNLPVSWSSFIDMDREAFIAT